MESTNFPLTVAELTKELIRFASVTPEDKGVQAFLADMLKAEKFECFPIPIGRNGRPIIQNLVATHGTGHPHLAFNGHTDVVDQGDLEKWTVTPPFIPLELDGYIYGRGAEDMKGGLAAAVMAAIEFVRKNPEHPGTISLMITGDEETDGYDGTPWIAEWIKAHNLIPDACVIPEPASTGGLCQTVRTGSRGCFEAKVKILGKQGHSAYPKKALNPIHAVAPLFNFFRTVDLDRNKKHEQFEPTSVQVVSVESGNMDKYNIIPGDLTFNLNVRYTNFHTTETLEAWLRKSCKRFKLDYNIIDPKSFSEAYVTTPGPFTDLVQSVIKSTLGVDAILSVLGGASDARVLAKIFPTVEIGPTNETLHQVNERVSIDELTKLQQVYEELLTRYLV